MYTEIHYLYELYHYTFHCISILLSLIVSQLVTTNYIMQVQASSVTCSKFTALKGAKNGYT
jgi:hypothetical protein